jgi:hypothetical protein
VARDISGSGLHAAAAARRSFSCKGTCYCTLSLFLSLSLAAVADPSSIARIPTLTNTHSTRLLTGAPFCFTELLVTALAGVYIPLSEMNKMSADA